MENLLTNASDKTEKIIDKNEIFPGNVQGQSGMERFDDLEGIIGNEPPKNKYETVKFHKLNIFPYFLIGKVQTKFEINGMEKFLNGVGILIGPETLLTVAHNIVTMLENEIVESKRIYFYPAANGDFTVFDNVKSVKTYVNKEYVAALKSGDRLSQINNDWGLVYLSSPVGLEITTLFGLNETYAYYLNMNKDRLYSYFAYNESQDLKKFQSLSQKISIIGYTECKEKYRDNAMYRFRRNFTQGNGEREPEKEERDQNINININITSQENVATEGLVSSSRFANNKAQAKNNILNTNNINGSDYIIFGNEQYNKDSEVSDTDKLVMSESKGNLIENEDNFIKYKISTYKGQSGSPIFLRIKRLTNKENFSDKDQTEKKHVYIYHFIGLHSRRGPLNDELSSKGFDTENGDLAENTSSKIETKNSKENVLLQDELVKIHGICDYNIALSIIGSQTKTIVNAVRELNQVNNLVPQSPKLNSNFLLVKLIMNDEEKLTGVFKKTTALELIFNIGAKILNVPKEYVLIRDLSNPDLSDIIQNYNFDNNKLIVDLIEPNNFLVIYDVMLNFGRYGELLANKIVDKFMENYDLEFDQVRKDFERKYSKKIFQAIFAEINSFENIYPAYGKLFKKIRKTILKKISC